MRSVATKAGAAALLLTLLLSGCTRGAAERATSTLLRIGFGIGRSAQVEGVRVLTDNLYAEGLLRHDWSGRTMPSLIGAWEWAPDHKEVTLRLKPGVYFHDGTLLTAETVVPF